MKKITKFSVLAMSLVVGGILGSCSSENDPKLNLNSSDMLVKAPEFKAYSGTHEWNSNGVPGTRSGAESGSFERWQGDRDWNEPPRISESEMNYVLKYLQEHPNEGYKSVDIDTYILQVVGGAKHSYQGDTPDHNGTWHTVNNASGEMRYCEIDGFFTQYNNTECNSEQAMLIRNVPATNATYKDTYGTTWDDCYAFYFITFPDEPEYGYMAGQTGLYLCYDFKTWKDSEQWGVSPDGIYDDWVIKLSPFEGGFFEEPKGEEPKEEPKEDPKPDNETCDDCGHLLGSHDGDGVCDDCRNGVDGRTECAGEEPGGEENHGDDEIEKPGRTDNGRNEVEVNLHGTDKGDILESHLSIHVRHATDVEVFIPIPNDLVCEADDLVISQIHDKNHSVHGGHYSVEYVLQDKEDGPYVVTLNLEYLEGGIRIWTDGITQEVIDFCFKHYQDGLNFEVWNYFDPEVIDFDTLKEYLNQAVITFLDDIPDEYINAFGENADGSRNADDANVSIVDNQKDQFESEPETGEHLNGSHHNEIYDKRNK